MREIDPFAQLVHFRISRPLQISSTRFSIDSITISNMGPPLLNPYEEEQQGKNRVLDLVPAFPPRQTLH